MSTSEATDLNPTDPSSTDLDLNSDASTTELVEAVTELSEQVSDLQATVEEQQETIEEQAQTIEDLQATVRMRGREVAETRQQVAELEQTVEEHGPGHTNPGESMDETTMQEPCTEPQTDIEQMVDMPDSLLEDQTANVQRAVFVASDVEAYTTSCPAGRVIKSSELRRVLEAGTECNGHSQTVARVIDLLDRTGGEDIKVVERRDQRRVVFSDDLVDRLSALTSQSRGGDSQRGQAV